MWIQVGNKNFNQFLDCGTKWIYCSSKCQLSRISRWKSWGKQSLASLWSRRWPSNQRFVLTFSLQFVLVLQKPLIGESEASIPELYQCFLQKESSRKIIKLKVSSKSNRTVVYCTEQSLPSSQYAIGVVSRSLDKVKPGLRSTSFTYESSKRPQILDAVYRQSLKIIVHFDVKIQCLKESCKAILKTEPAFKDEEGWSCNCVRNKLIISLEENEDLPVEGESLLPQKLIFLENNGVVQKGSNLEGKALPVLQGSNITIRHRESKQLEVRDYWTHFPYFWKKEEGKHFSCSY